MPQWPEAVVYTCSIEERLQRIPWELAKKTNFRCSTGYVNLGPLDLEIFNRYCFVYDLLTKYILEIMS